MAFHFKQFKIEQENAPFKIGTDGLLLGAWAAHEQAKNILDIGTGTGLIALMMAQRFPLAAIEAIELNPQAAKIASHNFEQSPWKDRISTQIGDFKSHSFAQTFDLLVSNPPFFSSGKLSEMTGKNLARHNIELTLAELMESSSKLLSKKGVLGIVLPYDLMEETINIGSQFDFFPKRICKVLPTPNSAPKRFLVEFSFVKTKLQTTELVLEESGRHNYSATYKALTRPFILDK